MIFRFPGKTFLLGEYAVLGGGDAVMIGAEPWFEAKFTPGVEPASPFHPDSPAGRWLASHPLEGSLEFRDAHGGKGGFGGSGAEFLAAYFSQFPLPKNDFARGQAAEDAWRQAKVFPGSGADILTQAWGVNYGKNFLLSVDTRTGRTELLESNLGATISLFHTGVKVKTHEALSAPAPKEALSAQARAAKNAILRSDLPALANAVTIGAKLLREAGLQARHTINALDTLPRDNVLAAKGCGAMGADVIAVLHFDAALGLWAAANSLAEVAHLSV